ncbi:MAG: phosphatidylglycerophosphatase A [Planctomycetota bacterium]
MSYITKTARIVIVTAGGAGLSKYAPGTCGSIAAFIAILFFPDDERYIWFCAAGIVITTILSLALGRFAERDFSRKDPEAFVLDEVAGMWLAALSITKPPLHWLVAAFALFRWLDIKKPFGIKKLQKYPGGTGIVIDDLAAGAVALAIGLAGRGAASLAT